MKESLFAKSIGKYLVLLLKDPNKRFESYKRIIILNDYDSRGLYTNKVLILNAFCIGKNAGEDKDPKLKDLIVALNTHEHDYDDKTIYFFWLEEESNVEQFLSWSELRRAWSSNPTIESLSTITPEEARKEFSVLGKIAKSNLSQNSDIGF